MGSRRGSGVPLLLLLVVCFVALGQAKEEEFEGFFEDGLEKEDLETPFVAPPGRAREQPASRVRVDEKPEVIRRSRVDPLEFWDDEEFEGFPEEEEKSVFAAPAAAAGESLEEVIGDSEKKLRPRSPFSPYLEIAGILFFLVYATLFWFGRKQNEKIALAWATEFAGTDSILEKNFSLLGFGDEPDAPSLVKEGQNTFKFYASGRRYCESLLATLTLKNRQDLLSHLLYLVLPARDEITIQVNMNDDAMEPLVFAVAQKKKAKELLRDVKDLSLFASILSKRGMADDLAVIAESRDLAADLLPEILVDQVFATTSPYFTSLHFSDQFPESKHKKVLEFSFVLPPLDKLTETKRLVALVPYYIDLIGRYKMGAAVKSKATAVREKLRMEEYKEQSKARQEAIQKKKAEQQTPLSSKKEEKERLRQLKKSMPKVKMSRGH